MNVPTESWKNISEAVISLGKESLDLIQRFLSGHISRDDLSARLKDLSATDVMSQYWDLLTSDAKFVPHWQVLQTLNGLIEEMDFQLGEYGESTLHEDMKEIAINLQRISDSMM